MSTLALILLFFGLFVGVVFFFVSRSSSKEAERLAESENHSAQVAGELVTAPLSASHCAWWSVERYQLFEVKTHDAEGNEKWEDREEFEAIRTSSPHLITQLGNGQTVQVPMEHVTIGQITKSDERVDRQSFASKAGFSLNINIERNDDYDDDDSPFHHTRDERRRVGTRTVEKILRAGDMITLYGAIQNGHLVPEQYKAALHVGAHEEIMASMHSSAKTMKYISYAGFAAAVIGLVLKLVA